MIKQQIDLMLENIPKEFGARTIEVGYMHKNALGKSYKGLTIEYNSTLPVQAITIKQ